MSYTMGAGAAPSDPSGGDTSDAGMGADTGASADQSPQVLVTIAQAPDGGYLVYAGDEPDSGDDTGPGTPGESSDDAAALSAGAGSGAAAPQHAASIGEALKAALDILNGDAGGGASQDQFQAGFAEPTEPTPSASTARRR